MHLIVTRPEPDASIFAARLEGIGCRVTLSPVLETVLSPIAAGELDGAAALVATSRNALRALAASPALERARRLPLYAVGLGTAKAAREIGLQTVIEGRSGAQDLTDLIISSRHPGDGALVHLAGEKLAFDLAGALGDKGFEVRTVTAYRMVAAQILTGEAVAAIASGAASGAVLMSPNSAQVFCALLERHGLVAAARRLDYFCLSRAVADALKPVAPAHVTIADRPDAEELLALIARKAAQSHRGL